MEQIRDVTNSDVRKQIIADAYRNDPLYNMAWKSFYKHPNLRPGELMEVMLCVMIEGRSVLLDELVKKNQDAIIRFFVDAK